MQQYKKPNVTELAGMLHSEKLMYWANKIGLDGERLGVFKMKSKSNGNERHNAIKRYLSEGVIEIENEPLIQKFEKFLDGKAVIDFEQKIETDLFRGRYDFQFIQGGETYIADFKSKCKRIYLNQKIQLVCYGMAKGIENLCLVSLEDFSMFQLDKKEIPFLKEIVCNLSNIHKNIFLNDNIN